jgi:arginyl-tRNA synthetase
MNPRALAEKIVAALGQVSGVAKIEIAGPGFINFTLAPETIAKVIDDARTADMWGSNESLKGSGQVLIEYTSPNLFKPLHVGNLVGNTIGESASRLMQFSGGDVKRINYPSDIGLPAAKVVWGLRKTGGNPEDIKALGEAYRVGNESYENDEVAKKEIDTVNKKLYDGSDAELNSLRGKGVATSRKHLDDLCEKLGTIFDQEIFESEAAPVGKEIVESHPETFPLSEGARVFTGGSHVRVFLTSAGLTTYEAKDLGNFVLKQKKFPDWHTYIVITGVEQKEYFGVLYAAVRAVFPEVGSKNFKYIPTGLLTPTTGKMSSRKGNVITAEDMLADLAESAKERAAESRADNKDVLADQVAVAALKYEVLKQASGRNIIFDRQKALSLEGDSGPYLQYAYARTCAIVQKAKEMGVAATVDASISPNTVARMIPRFPEVVARAADLLEPHLVTTYLLELASSFNAWYAQEQILDGTPAAAHKLALVEAVGRTLKNGLWILGIPAPEKM